MLIYPQVKKTKKQTASQPSRTETSVSPKKTDMSPKKTFKVYTQFVREADLSAVINILSLPLKCFQKCTC